MTCTVLPTVRWADLLILNMCDHHKILLNDSNQLASVINDPNILSQLQGYITYTIKQMFIQPPSVIIIICYNTWDPNLTVIPLFVHDRNTKNQFT